MAQQMINLGAVADDGTGDTLRAGGQKINENFTELYTSKQAKSTKLDGFVNSVPMVGVRLSVTTTQLQTLLDALPADQTSEVHVRWATGARMKTGDALYTFIKTTLGFDDPGMAALMTNAATFD